MPTDAEISKAVGEAWNRELTERKASKVREVLIESIESLRIPPPVEPEAPQRARLAPVSAVRSSRAVAPTTLSQAIRKHVIAMRNLNGWNLDDLAGRLTEVGYLITASNIANREGRCVGGKGTGGDVTADEAVALAKVLGYSGVDELIKVADQPCPRCQGSPPEGFACKACGAGA